MTPTDRDLDVRDVRVWVGSRDFDQSYRFYTALGWATAWTDGDGLAQLELAGHRLMLQDHYERVWNENSMITIDVASASDWYDHVAEVIDSGEYGDARVAPPQEQDFGAVVTYAWDPSGVLLHFTEWRST